MKYVKYLLLLVCLYFVSGCSAVYNVELKDDTLNELLTVTGSEITEQFKKTYTTYPLPVSINNGCFLDYDSEEDIDTNKLPSVNYYDVKALDNGLELSANVKRYNYQDSRIANSFFNKMHFNNYSNFTSFYGYDGLMAFKEYSELEEVTINITVDKEVTDHDADEVNGNTYTWKFNRKTNKDKTLYLEMDVNKMTHKGPSESAGSFLKNNLWLIIFIIIILVLSGLILYKRRFNNT